MQLRIIGALRVRAAAFNDFCLSASHFFPAVDDDVAVCRMLFHEIGSSPRLFRSQQGSPRSSERVIDSLALSGVCL